MKVVNKMFKFLLISITLNFLFCRSGTAAKLIAETWPTPIVYSGNEIGQAIRTGSRLFTETPETNPIRASYENHPFVDTTTKERQSWDQTPMFMPSGAPRIYGPCKAMVTISWSIPAKSNGESIKTKNTVI